MKGFIRERRVSYAISSLGFVALGAVLIMWPDESLKWMCRLLGAVLLASGVVFIINYLTKKKISTIFQIDLIIGIILAVIGVWLITGPEIVISFIQYVFGAVLIIHGIIDLQGAVSLHSGKSDRWWTALLFAVITIALGAIIIYNPFATMSALVMLIGIALVYDGISDILIMFAVSATARRMEKTAKQVEADSNVIETEGETIK